MVRPEMELRIKVKASEFDSSGRRLSDGEQRDNLNKYMQNVLDHMDERIFPIQDGTCVFIEVIGKKEAIMNEAKARARRPGICVCCSAKFPDGVGRRDRIYLDRAHQRRGRRMGIDAECLKAIRLEASLAKEQAEAGYGAYSDLNLSLMGMR
jgi:hypothetical protein